MKADGFKCTIRPAGCGALNNTPHIDFAVDARMDAPGKVCLFSVHNGDNQIWEFIPSGTPYHYFIKSMCKNLSDSYLCNKSGNDVTYGPGDIGHEWHLINVGKVQNKPTYLLQNTFTGNYLDSGPHNNHCDRGVIYTNQRCGIEQTFFLFDKDERELPEFFGTLRPAGCGAIGGIDHFDFCVDASLTQIGTVCLYLEHNADNQVWDFIPSGEPHTYYIRNMDINFIKRRYLYNSNESNVELKFSDGILGSGYKWILNELGNKNGHNILLIQNCETKRYLDSGPHYNHHNDGTVYTFIRAGDEQTFSVISRGEKATTVPPTLPINVPAPPSPKSQGMILQKNSIVAAIRQSGSCFLGACYIGGLTTYEQCLDCYYWAVNSGKIRGSDCYVNCDKKNLALEISQRYGTEYKDGCSFSNNNRHFWVVRNGVEVYNSAGIGWR